MRVFVTGASGWIGSAVVPELIGAGHQVTGLARSDASAAALTSAGAQVVRGTIDDLDTLRSAAQDSDGVIHLAFKHDVAFAEGDFQAAADADRRAIDAFGDALAGSDKPFVIASGLLGVAPGKVATERDGLASDSATDALNPRQANAWAAAALADRGVRSSVLRLPPTVHGDGDKGFISSVIDIARAKGVSGYPGDGTNHWPAAHRSDVANLFRLALEKAPAGSTLHAASDQGVPVREVAEVIGRQLDVPVTAIADDAAAEHFGWVSIFFALDCQATSEYTRELLGWQPTQPGLIEDLEKGHYFQTPAA